MGNTRRCLTAAATLAIAALTAGCGTASHPTPPPVSVAPAAAATGAPSTTTTLPPGPTSAQLASELLKVSDMPTGWKSTKVDNSSSSGSFCGIGGQAKSTSSGDAEADFADGEFPIFDEEIAGYQSLPTARFAKVMSELSQCTSFKVSGQTFTLGQMSFPAVGSQSAAFQASGSVQGFTVGIDLVFAVKGNQLVLFIFGDLGSPDATQLQTFAQQAVAKMPSAAA